MQGKRIPLGNVDEVVPIRNVSRSSMISQWPVRCVQHSCLNDLWEICQWSVNGMFNVCNIPELIICQWSVNDLSDVCNITHQLSVNDLWVICQWSANGLSDVCKITYSMICQWYVRCVQHSSLVQQCSEIACGKIEMLRSWMYMKRCRVVLKCWVWDVWDQALPGTARHCQVLPGTARYCQVLPGTARRCQVLPGTRHIRTLPVSGLRCWEPVLLRFFHG